MRNGYRLRNQFSENIVKVLTTVRIKQLLIPYHHKNTKEQLQTATLKITVREAYERCV
ncbi:MAG: hypothetical protein GX556_00280 [Fibrobacter sp.]|nr:hypothetical protein [Fibrobacter sp.]